MLAHDQLCALYEPAPADADQLRGLERRRLVESMLPLRAQGKSYQECAKLLGSSAATLCRLERAWKSGGDAALETKHSNAGRPRLAGCLTPEEVAYAKRRYLESESYPLAFENLADSPICTEPTRELLNRYRDSGEYPPSVRAALHVTEEVKNHFKGPKTSQGTVYATSRGMFIRDENGKDHEIVSGDIFEQDDVSVDVPYYVQLPDGSYRVGRQVLVCQDLRSGKYMAACAIARPRDSYRAEDILRFNRWLVESHGLPKWLRFERGSWESDGIRGIDIGGDKRWGGLSQLIPTQHMFTSNGKAIEGSFRLLHKALGMHGVRIGKSRGEYEQPSADMMAVNEGRKDPKACGFIAWADLLAKFEATFSMLNGRLRYDRVTHTKIAPDDLWWRDMQARPNKALPACNPELFYHFLPVKAMVSLGAVRAGQVQVTVPGYQAPFRFRCAGEGIPYLERGHKLVVCFDPQTAAEGAVIFNADTTERSGGEHRYLERLFVAPLAEERPQIDLSGTAAQSPEILAKKKREAQVRTAFTSIGSFGQGARRVHQSHDGAGNVRSVETGTAPRSRAATAEPVQAPREAVAKATQTRRIPAKIDEDFSTPVATTPSRVATPAVSPLIEEW